MTQWLDHGCIWLHSENEELGFSEKCFIVKNDQILSQLNELVPLDTFHDVCPDYRGSTSTI